MPKKPDPRDELFRRAPDSVKKLLAEHKTLKRKEDRATFKKNNPDRFKK